MEAMVVQSDVTAAYYSVKDVMAILGCKQTKAQDVIRQLNDEMVSQGYMRYPKGKVSRKYFNERFGR